MIIKDLINKVKIFFKSKNTDEQDTKPQAYDIPKEILDTFVITSGKIYIDKSRLNIKYYMDYLSNDRHIYYFLHNANIDIAKEDILSINSLLLYAKSECGKIPSVQINESDLCFEDKVINNFPQFCCIIFRELTKTGKIAKYPYMLDVRISEDLFGEIYYNQQNEIGKIRFIIKTYTETYELSFILNEGAIKLSIYKTDYCNYKREKIYPYNNQK